MDWKAEIHNDLSKGTFFKYVRSFWAFFDPLPPLSAMCLHLCDPLNEYVRNSVPPPPKKGPTQQSRLFKTYIPAFSSN